jgi:hypothetical protein
MIVKIFCLVMILAITWVWLNRGFFSAFVHMLCTIAAGAIAFAFWEPLAYLIMGLSPEKGFLTFLDYIAWGAALLLPFGLSLIVLRFITDAMLKTKVSPLSAVDYAGGAICGGVSAMITVGVLFIGYGFMPGAGSVRPVDYSTESAGIGSLRRAGGLWIPAEKFTAGLYGQLSNTSLRTGTPLAEYYPDLDVTGYAINISVAEGKARPQIDPDAIRVKKIYTVGDPNGATPAAQLLADGVGPDPFIQRYQDINGESIGAGRLYGLVVEFGEKAKETNGQVIMGNGQARLLMRGPDGTRVAHPVALVSQARSSDAELYGRFAYDSEELFIASVGGASKATMGFEFLLPQGYEPEALIIKNTRIMLDEVQGEPQSFPSPAARFAALNSGSLVGGASVADLDTADAARVEFDPQNVGPRTTQAIVVSDRIGYSFEVRQKGGLEIDEKNAILRGSQKFNPGDLNARGLNQKVTIDSFATAPDVSIVKVNVSRESPASLLGGAARTAERVLPPQLVDVNGQAYPAVGYIYEDKTIVEISYDPAQSIRGLAQLPTVSSSRSDQKLSLVFRVSKGVQVRYFSIGNKVIAEFEPPVEVD